MELLNLIFFVKFIYIYIYIEREREREDTCIYVYMEEMRPLNDKTVVETIFQEDSYKIKTGKKNLKDKIFNIKKFGKSKICNIKEN